MNFTFERNFYNISPLYSPNEVHIALLLIEEVKPIFVPQLLTALLLRTILNNCPLFGPQIKSLIRSDTLLCVCKETSS